MIGDIPCPICDALGLDEIHTPWPKSKGYWNEHHGIARGRPMNSPRYSRKWRMVNPEKSRQSTRRWARANRDKIREKDRKYQQTHPEVHRRAFRKWRSKHPEKRAERERNLHISKILGEYIDGWQLHHMKSGMAIWMPASIHRMIRHSLTRDRNMALIDTAAIELLRNSWLLEKGHAQE